LNVEAKWFVINRDTNSPYVFPQERGLLLYVNGVLVDPYKWEEGVFGGNVYHPSLNSLGCYVEVKGPKSSTPELSVSKTKMSDFLGKPRSKMIVLPLSSTSIKKNCGGMFGDICTLNKLNKGSQLLNISFLTTEKELLLQSGIVLENKGMIKDIANNYDYIYLECVNCGYNDEKYNRVKYQSLLGAGF
jgi:hypothetical protein